jgi:hypothetical protein
MPVNKAFVFADYRISIFLLRSLCPAPKFSASGYAQDVNEQLFA